MYQVNAVTCTVSSGWIQFFSKPLNDWDVWLNALITGIVSKKDCPSKSEFVFSVSVTFYCLGDSRFKASLSHLSKKLFHFLQWKSFKMKNAFYLIFKALFVLLNVLSFWPYRKSGLIRKVRWISKFMTSQPG